METTIHNVKKVTVGRVRKLKASGTPTYVRDIVITSDKEQLVIAMFTDEMKNFIPEILEQGDNT